MALTCEVLRQELHRFAEEVLRQEIEDLRGHVADIREKVREDLREALHSRGRLAQPTVGIPSAPRLAVRRHASAAFTRQGLALSLPQFDKDGNGVAGEADEDLLFAKNMKVYEDIFDNARKKHASAKPRASKPWAKKPSPSGKTRSDGCSPSSAIRLSAPPCAIAAPRSPESPKPEPPGHPKIDFPAPPTTPTTAAATAASVDDEGLPGSPMARSHNGLPGMCNGHVGGDRHSVSSIEGIAALRRYTDSGEDGDRLRGAGDNSVRAFGSTVSPVSPAGSHTSRRPSIASGTSSASRGRRRSQMSHQAIRELEELRPPPTNAFERFKYGLEDFVRSAYFDYVSGSLVVLNAITLGWQTDWQARHATEDSTTGFRLIEIFFCVSFTVELLMRIVVYQQAFFDVRDIKWNLFDTLLVGTQLAEEVMRIAVFQRVDFSGEDAGNAGGMGDKLSILRVLRILRLIRIMRVMRILRLIGDLRTLVMSILGSLKSLMWAVVLLFVMMYVIGVYLTQLVLDHRLRLEDPEDANGSLVLFYGSVGDSVFILFEAVTGGIDWGEAVEPLRSEISTMLVPLFMLYISFVVLCMLNVITGVFVESALLTARRDKDIYMVNHARQLFAQVDSARSGTISWEQFEEALESEDMREVFKQLDLDVSEALGLFQLLDTDRTGNIDADEFISGCTRLRGPAKALDLNLLKMQTRLHWEKMMKHHSRIERTVGQLSLSLSAVLPEVDNEVFPNATESDFEESLDTSWLDRNPMPHLGGGANEGYPFDGEVEV